MRKNPLRLLVLFVSLVLILSGCSAAIPTGTAAPTSTPTSSPTQTTNLTAVDLMAGVQAAAWPQSPDIPSQAAITALNRFAEGLLLRSSANPGNVMVSPVSVFLALAMTANGADTETEQAMLKVLADCKLTAAEINQLARDYMTLLAKDGDKTTVSIANSIWFADRFNPYPPFLQANADFYRAGARKLDFADETSKDIINAWVNQETRGLIKTIIEKISPSTVMFLINTVYFKSDWQTPFLKEETRKQVFHAPSGDLDTDFMHRVDKMSYFTGNGAVGVALPYADSQFAFFALMAEDGSSPRQWLATQTQDQLFAGITALMAQKANFTVDLSLPRFEAEYEDSLINELSDLGMGIAFDGSRADFSRLNAERARGLFISEVKHKTFIRVDEKGTEAAAATSVAIDESAIMSDKQLVFDRPFIYGIIDLKTHTPLFAGILEKPAS